MKLVAVLTAAAVLTLSPVAAHADAGAHSDRTGDVRLIGPDAGPNDPGTGAPSRAEGDIKAIRVNHLPRKVRVTLVYRQLAQKVDGEAFTHGFYYRVRAEGMTRRIALSPDEPNRRDRLVMTTPTGKRVSCVLSATVGYDVDQVVLDIPRSCLGTPGWVRVGAGSGSAGNAGGYYDDARASLLHSDLILGPRIYC